MNLKSTAEPAEKSKFTRNLPSLNNMTRKATREDYVKIQGGVPNVWQDPEGLWHIQHDYDHKDPIHVKTHNSPEQRGTVVVGGVEYQTSLLRRFEGDPCEKVSMKAGGERYDRER